jgi:hypothetical protein
MPEMKHRWRTALIIWSEKAEFPGSRYFAVLILLVLILLGADSAGFGGSPPAGSGPIPYAGQVQGILQRLNTVPGGH